MENSKGCAYPNCGNPATSICNCVPAPIFLCPEHTLQHFEDSPYANHSLKIIQSAQVVSESQCAADSCTTFPTKLCRCGGNLLFFCDRHLIMHTQTMSEKEHAIQPLVCPLRPAEGEAIKKTKELLIQIHIREISDQMNELNEERKSLFDEISENTNSLLEKVKRINCKYTTYLNRMKVLVGNIVNELDYLEATGIATMKKSAFQQRLFERKQRGFEITYAKVLQDIKEYWRELEEEGEIQGISHILPSEMEIAAEWVGKSIDVKSPQLDIDGTIQCIQYSGITNSICDYLLKELKKSFNLQTKDSIRSLLLRMGIKEATLDRYHRLNDYFTFEEILSHNLQKEEVVSDRENGSNYQNQTLYSMAFSLNGLFYATGCGNTIYIFSTSTMKVIHTLSGHHLDISTICFAPNNESLVSGSLDGTIRFWRLSNGENFAIIADNSSTSLQQEDSSTSLQQENSPVFSIDYSKTGEFIACGTENNTIKLWRVPGDLIHSFSGHSSSVHSVVFSHDDKLIASGSEDRTIKIWDLLLFQLIYTFSGHSQGVKSVCFSSDSLLLVSGSDDTTVKLWNIDTAEMIYTIQGQMDQVNVAVFSSDDQLIAAGGQNNTISIWKVCSGSLIAAVDTLSSPVQDIKFSPDGTILASRDLEQLKLFSLL